MTPRSRRRTAWCRCRRSCSSSCSYIVIYDHGFEQASHNGELAQAVASGALEREQATELGFVLAGEAEGRRSDAEITTFDSTGLAIQDLAIALAALEQRDELDLATIEL
ncbi:MAG TPA: hypothetical protein VLK24_10740 [Gaiellaceae bacterium]|nr:hypothetical protein [Gaiellaceae bacterium]